MKADITWLDQPEVYRVNQISAHSDHLFYKDKMECENMQNSLCQNLNGKWKFCFSRNAMERPEHFYEQDFNSNAFDEITVPQHIEMAGYDKIHYINTMYPWEGHEYRRPTGTVEFFDAKGMFSQASYNPVGSYLCYFDLNDELMNKKIHIVFEGVEQAMYLWLNGSFVGYAEDSFTVSEFDLTPYIKNKNNILAVEVHKRSTAAFLEDQDFFRFFGIFRDVKMYAIPEVHIEDLWIHPEVDLSTCKGNVKLDLHLSDMQVTNSQKDMPYAILTISNDIEECLKERILLKDHVSWFKNMQERVTLWDAKQPYLYLLEIEVYDGNGILQEYIPYQFGFRRIEIQNNVMLLNGKRLVLAGVNRHEWNPESGRCITEADEKFDICCLKRNHINAVRTCHYPDRISWYYKCDLAGIYVMAETNLESHGSWQKNG